MDTDDQVVADHDATCRDSGRLFANTAGRQKPSSDATERTWAHETRTGRSLLARPVAFPSAIYLWTMIKYRDGAQNFSESGISNDPRKDVPSRSATFTSSRL